MMKKRYDIFISYRRSSFDTANLIATKLSVAGYNVFIDIETLRSGKFNEKLFEVIEGCTDFILVLPQNALNRCVNDDDWVRKEVEHALKHNKNIIPIMLRGFEWPDAKILPLAMQELPNYNAITATDPNVFAENMERLKKNFLLSRPISKYLRILYILFTLIVIAITSFVALNYHEWGRSIDTLGKDVIKDVEATIDTMDFVSIEPDRVDDNIAKEPKNVHLNTDVVVVTSKESQTTNINTKAMYHQICVDYAKCMFNDYIKNDYIQSSLECARNEWVVFIKKYNDELYDRRLFIDNIQMYKNTLIPCHGTQIFDDDIIALRACGLDVSDINDMNENSKKHYDLVVEVLDFMIQCAECKVPSIYDEYIKLYAEYSLKQLEYNYYTLLWTLSKMPDVIYDEIYKLAPAIEHFTMVSIQDKAIEYKRMISIAERTVNDYSRKLSGVKDMDDDVLTK